MKAMDFASIPIVEGGCCGEPITPTIPFSVSIVRHPYTWLQSLYHNQPRRRYYANTHLNQLIHYASITPTFSGYARLVADNPGWITQAFDFYKSSMVLRLEDFPWAVLEFIESFESSESAFNLIKARVSALEPLEQNYFPTVTTETADTLRGLLVSSEKDFCLRYSYW
jgi:hypothetical protein